MIAVILAALLTQGCGITLYEKKPDESRNDMGSKTTLDLEGPTAKVCHEF